MGSRTRRIPRSTIRRSFSRTARTANSADRFLLRSTGCYTVAIIRRILRRDDSAASGLGDSVGMMIVVDSQGRPQGRFTSRRFDSRQRIRIYRYSMDATLRCDRGYSGRREYWRTKADDTNNLKDRALGVLGYEEFIVPTFFVTARGTLNKFYNGLLILISYVLPVSRIAAYVFSKP